MRGRRTPYEIYWEILVFCRTPRPVTSIVTRCDLNSRLAQEYLGFLTGKGYLAVVREAERTLYQTTENAREYLTLFTTMHQTLFNENPGFKLVR